MRALLRVSAFEMRGSIGLLSTRQRNPIMRKIILLAIAAFLLKKLQSRASATALRRSNEVAP